MRLSISILALLILSACSNPADKLPRYDHVPNFQLTDENSKRFSSSELNGKVWVADFIYTSCPAACPMMTSRLKEISGQLNPAVQLVSISIDPENDTPAAMKAFAGRYGIVTPRWSFLTGTPNTVHLLAWSTFHVGDIITKMNHSTKFVLVDGKGVIRGYYSSLDPDSNQQLVRDANDLAREH